GGAVHARFGTDRRTWNRQAGLHQTPQVGVLARDPDGLLRAPAGTRLVLHGLGGSSVGDEHVVPVDGVVAEGAGLDVGVDLGGVPAPLARDEVDGGFLATLDLSEQGVEVAALV